MPPAQQNTHQDGGKDAAERQVVPEKRGANGEAMVANKVHGVRCALCWNEEVARLSRQHNDANVLSLGQRVIPEEMAMKIVRIWLDTPFEGGRHIKRVEQLNAM